MDELAAYLDAGRTPVDPAIEESPACRRALTALRRLRAVSADFLTDDVPPESDDPWIERIMRGIGGDSRAGADLVLETTPEGHQVLTTEGAVRALIRAAGDRQPGALVGRARFDGDPSDATATGTVQLDLWVAYGVVIPDATARVRAAVVEALRFHTRGCGPSRSTSPSATWSPEPSRAGSGCSRRCSSSIRSGRASRIRSARRRRCSAS